jgi:hypothetical protein
MVVSVLAAAACSTTQPDRITGRTASLSFTAFGDVKLYDCYEVWQDTSIPPDGTADVFLDQTACFDGPVDDNNPLVKTKNVPWHFSLAVTVIHAGSTVEEIVTSRDGVHGTTLDNADRGDDFLSMTDYDPDQPPSPAVQPPQGDVIFLNGKRVRAGARLFSTSGSLACPVCPVDLGPPNILGGASNFAFDFTSGDTIIVRARKQRLLDSPGVIPSDPDPKVTLIGSLSVGGTPVAVNGTSTSSTDDGAGFTFSFTVR